MKFNNPTNFKNIAIKARKNDLSFTSQNYIKSQIKKKNLQIKAKLHVDVPKKEISIIMFSNLDQMQIKNVLSYQMQLAFQL